jgi:hypothetical protein
MSDIVAHSCTNSVIKGIMVAENMTYSSEISRNNPGLFIFMIDQSRSMSHKLGGGSRSKAAEAADAINRQIGEIINRCTKSEGVRHYFDIGIVGYGARRGEATSMLSGATLVPINEMESRILKTETRKQTIDGQEIDYEFPVWFEPVAASDTPMVKAIDLARQWAQEWASGHSDSFPPIVINLTDGEATDGNPVDAMEELKSVSTNDGNVLIWNCHLSENRTKPVSFPSTTNALPEDKYAGILFEMSSELPEGMIAIAKEEYTDVSTGARGYVFNAQLEDLIKLLDIGTRAASTLMK